jgi:hypothetical protein
MSNELSLFFQQNAATETEEEYVVSERFKDKDGKAVPWKLRTISEVENSDIRKSATKRVQIKRGVTYPETNPNEYLSGLIVASVVFPNLKDAELQKSYGVIGAESLIRTMLYAGEYASLSEKVQEINGFNKDINDLVEEAKN